MSVDLSIITINLNNALGLIRSLKSIENQHFKNFELIVIDGGSVDDSIDIIKQFASLITYFVSERDEGIYDAMNKGIALACGKYVHLLNSGDIYSNESSLLKVDFSTNIEFFCFAVLKHGPKPFIWNPEVLSEEGFVHCAHPGLIVRRDIYVNNLYNGKYKYISDAIFIYNNVKPSLSIVDNRILVEMEPNGVSSKISFKHEVEKFRMLWKEGYRKNKKMLIQVKYIIVFLLKIFRIKW
jgi:glycosyltransferase involved in cell wall biosynthesis